MSFFSKRDDHANIPDPGSADEETPMEALNAARDAVAGALHTIGVFDEQTQLVLDSIGEGIMVLDQDLRARYVNREAKKLIGEVAGQRLDTFLERFTDVEGKETVPAEEVPPRRALRDGFPIKLVGLWHRTDEHEPSVVEVLATPLRVQGEVAGVVVALRNVAAQLALERELREFIAIASHQFKTPISSVNWFLEILLSGKVGELTKEQWELAQQAREAMNRLADTIRLTLNASSMEFGALSITPEAHDLGKLLQEEVNHIELFARRQNQKLELVLPRTTPSIPVDETIFRFILTNLLSNAVKYSREGGTITVTLTPESRRVLVAIRDEGLGIPKQDQDRIFTKFFRASNALMNTDGTGLGLYIVKQLLERTGGTIWFDSEDGKGTTFTVAIPKEGMKAVEGGTKLETLSRSLYGNI